MDTIQCAVVLAKLEVFDREIEARIEAAERYISLFEGNNAVAVPVIRTDRTSVWAQFTVQVEGRDSMVEALRQEGIPTAVHYPVPLHRQPAYKDVCQICGHLSNAERLGGRVLSLPMHPYISAETQEQIVAAISRAVRVRQ